MQHQKLLAITLIAALALFATSATLNNSFAATDKKVTSQVDKTTSVINQKNSSSANNAGIKTICYKAFVVQGSNQQNALVCYAITVQITK